MSGLVCFGPGGRGVVTASGLFEFARRGTRSRAVCPSSFPAAKIGEHRTGGATALGVGAKGEDGRAWVE